MTKLEPKNLTTPSDFFECAIWRYDEGDDLYHPVLAPDELPDSERDLSIRAVFTTPSGKKMDGYVVGISRVFSMGLFGREKLFHANKSLIHESEGWMRDFIQERPDLGLSSPEDIFPLKYDTQIHQDGYADFSGTFDLKG